VSAEQPISVPVDRVLVATQGQRNTAFDELAKAQAFIEQLAAERDELAAEVERLREANGDGGRPLA
jgi:hypothetical protein